MTQPITMLSTLLVGAHFRPPAKQVLQVLPSGTELGLRPEPENPYDELALAVDLPSGNVIPESQHEALGVLLEGTRIDLVEVIGDAPIHLGYVPKPENKDLKNSPYASYHGVREEIVRQGLWPRAHLAFSPAGKPLVVMVWNQEVAERDALNEAQAEGLGL